jgi:hypothetical protein
MFAAKDLLLSGAKPAVALDFAGAGTSGTATSLTAAHTAAINAWLIVPVTVFGSTTVSGVTFGGNAMTSMGSVANENNQASYGILYLFKYLNTSLSGSQNIVATFSGSQAGNIASTSWKNVTTVGAIQTTFGGTNTALSQSATSGVNGRVVQAFSAYGLGTSVSSYNQTLRTSNASGTTLDLLLGDAAGTGSSISFTATASAGVAWAGAATSLT